MIRLSAFSVQHTERGIINLLDDAYLTIQCRRPLVYPLERKVLQMDLASFFNVSDVKEGLLAFLPTLHCSLATSVMNSLRCGLYTLHLKLR